MLLYVHILVMIYMFSSGHEREDEQEKFRYIKKSEILSAKKWTYVDWIQYKQDNLKTRN